MQRILKPIMFNIDAGSNFSLCKDRLHAGADPGFDQGGGPDRDRPKTAILGPQFCRIFGAGASFLVVGGGPPWIRP